MSPYPVTPQFKAGEVYTRPHPFTYVLEQNGDPEFDIERWRPGAWAEAYLAPDEMVMGCHGHGTVTYTVISVHQPPGYQTRIFYKRVFTTPEGKRYAPGKLHNCIARKFAKDVKSFRFRYEVLEL